MGLGGSRKDTTEATLNTKRRTKGSRSEDRFHEHSRARTAPCRGSKKHLWIFSSSRSSQLWTETVLLKEMHRVHVHGTVLYEERIPVRQKCNLANVPSWWIVQKEQTKLMRDVKLLRECLDGKIPSVTTNDTEQIKNLILRSKEIRDGDCPKSMSNFPQSSLQREMREVFRLAKRKLSCQRKRTLKLQKQKGLHLRRVHRAHPMTEGREKEKKSKTKKRKKRG